MVELHTPEQANGEGEDHGRSRQTGQAHNERGSVGRMAVGHRRLRRDHDPGDVFQKDPRSCTHGMHGNLLRVLTAISVAAL